jgi:putative hydrolase of the HAD superfamily
MQPLRDIRAVTFDVGGTLIDPWPSVGDVYAEVAARHGLSQLNVPKLNRQFALAWKTKTSFDYSRAAWAKLVGQTFSDVVDPGGPITFFEELYERFGQPKSWRVHDDVLPAIEMLMERGLELGIVSNWDERLRPLLQQLRLDRFFRVIIISQEIGFCKPSPVIFEEAARKFACPASCVLHVGDGAIDDVQGARSAGLQSVLLNRNPATGARGAADIQTLGQLAELLER